MKTKVTISGDEATDVQDKETRTADFNCTCLAVITIDSPFKKDQNYHTQASLKEFKYVKKEVIRHIIRDK